MAFDAMESLFELDEDTTEADSINTTSIVPLEQYNRHENELGGGGGGGGMSSMMSFLPSGPDGKMSLPFCLDICALRDLLDIWTSLTRTVGQLETSVVTLEICMVILTVVVTIFAASTLALMLYYVRKMCKDEEEDGERRPRMGPGPPSVIDIGPSPPTPVGMPPSTASSSMSLNVRNSTPPTPAISPPIIMSNRINNFSSPPPPSRQSERVQTPIPSWVNVERMPTSYGVRGQTPMPLEIHDDHDESNTIDEEDDHPIAIPGGPAPDESSYLSARHALGKPSWTPLGPKVKPLTEHLHHHHHHQSNTTNSLQVHT